jgi:transcription initiation factor TFIIB
MNITKKKSAKINKKELWNIFDSEVLQKAPPLECIYRQCGNREFCDNCESSLHFSEDGFLTCTNKKCGIVYKDIIDQSAEWRYYGADDSNGNDPTRCGMPINPYLLESSFGCKVLYEGKMTYEMRKLRTYTEWFAVPYKEKSLYEDFKLITQMASNSGLSKKIIDDAIFYRKKISENSLTFRGVNKDGILAASIYIACRVDGYPRTAKEIAIMFNLDVASATKGCKNALSIINDMEKDLDISEKTNLCATKPEAFVERFCSKLNINNEITRLCQFVTLKIEKENYMAENTPHSIAASVVFFVASVCNLGISKKAVKNVSEISEVTISKCYKKLEQLKDVLIPAVILKKYNS